MCFSSRWDPRLSQGSNPKLASLKGRVVLYACNDSKRVSMIAKTFTYSVFHLLSSSFVAPACFVNLLIFRYQASSMSKTGPKTGSSCLSTVQWSIVRPGEAQWARPVYAHCLQLERSIDDFDPDTVLVIDELDNWAISQVAKDIDEWTFSTQLGIREELDAMSDDEEDKDTDDWTHLTELGIKEMEDFLIQKMAIVNRRLVSPRFAPYVSTY